MAWWPSVSGRMFWCWIDVGLMLDWCWMLQWDSNDVDAAVRVVESVEVWDIWPKSAVVFHVSFDPKQLQTSLHHILNAPNLIVIQMHFCEVLQKQWMRGKHWWGLWWPIAWPSDGRRGGDKLKFYSFSLVLVAVQYIWTIRCYRLTDFRQIDQVREWTAITISWSSSNIMRSFCSNWSSEDLIIAEIWRHQTTTSHRLHY